MNGYFARLLTRAQQPTPRVRPQAMLPFAAPLRVDDPEALAVVNDRSAMETGDAVGNASALRDERRSAAVPMPKSGRWDATHPSSGARTRDGGESRSAPSARGDARPVHRAHDVIEDDRRAAPADRMSHVGVPPQAARTDEEVSHDGGGDFWLLPPVLDADSATRRPTGGDDRTPFASAVHEARVQIARQLATQHTTPSEVHVTIGRIEVTAAPVAPTPPRRAPERVPATSLEQYLASRARRRT